jgi:hypothetical protein
MTGCVLTIAGAAEIRLLQSSEALLSPSRSTPAARLQRKCRVGTVSYLRCGGHVEMVNKHSKYAVERRRLGLHRSVSLTTGILAAAGAGTVAIAVSLAVSNPAAASGNSTGSSTGTSTGSSASSPSSNTNQQSTQTSGGGLAPAGNSAPQTRSHGS